MGFFYDDAYDEFLTFDRNDDTGNSEPMIV